MYHLSKTIFEKIEEESMAVLQELKYSQYRATFDTEVYHPGDFNNPPEKREKLEYTAEYQLLSISVASNVPGYEELQCFVVKDEGRQQALLRPWQPSWATKKKSPRKPAIWNCNALLQS